MSLATTLAKAKRLRSEGRVGEIDADVFSVRGDHANYIVVIPGDAGAPVCTCPARGDCSHMYAAKGELLAEKVAAEDPFDRFTRDRFANDDRMQRAE